MDKTFRILIWLFALSSFAHADVSLDPVKVETLAEAEAAITLTTKALNQATAWENLSRRELNKANQILAKKPKSAKAQLAVEAARKELASATAYKAKKNAELQEEFLEKAALEKASENKIINKVEVARKVTIYPVDQYHLFAEEQESLERIDAFNFFNDPLEYTNKAVILDARFDGMISPSVAKFTIWRNFGKMPLIVSNIPEGSVLPKNTTLLLAGLITDFKKEVVSGELIINALLMLKSVYVCSDSNCHGNEHL